MKTKEELKTLKDFPDGDRFGSFSFAYGKSLLKAEAVKVAKFSQKQMISASECKDEYSYFYWKGRLDEVMERNNLTKEDLK